MFTVMEERLSSYTTLYESIFLVKFYKSAFESMCRNINAIFGRQITRKFGAKTIP